GATAGNGPLRRTALVRYRGQCSQNRNQRMGGFLDLSGQSFGPAAGGKARRLVILLHGYGSNGDDLLALAPHWVRQLPDALFLSPNAPFPCEVFPSGYQWFGFEGRNEGMILAEV